MRTIGLTRAARSALLALPVAVVAVAIPLAHARDATTARRHGIAMHGELQRAPGFTHFSYVNPDAPKGGRLVLGHAGSFDSLNPLIIRGLAPPEVRDWIYEGLLVRALDEPFSLYGLLAESIEVPADRSAITFHLNPSARFSDGKPVTADDVIFTHALLKDKGRPYHRSYYRKVADIARLGERSVRFTFIPDGDREMPLILGLMPVLPRHRIDPATFEQTTLEPPVGSGPYTVSVVETGKTLLYRRSPDYWGRDLPAARGRFNFDEIRIEYIRDPNSLFEAFKTGAVDLRDETRPELWAEAYDFPAVKSGRVVKAEFELGVPAGMTALVLNTRRPLLADRRVRRALNLLFDFPWINRSLFHGLYARTRSYFERSELSSFGRPADGAERTLLAPHMAEVLPDVLEGRPIVPDSDGSGFDRARMKEAVSLLAAAGYVLKDGVMVQAAGGAPLAVEALAQTRGQERLLLTWSQTLKRVGIQLKIRQVDDQQYWARVRSFDFDIIQWTWTASLSPGNEQQNRWSRAAADTHGSLNYAGVRSAAVEAMIEALLKAERREDFVAAVRAFDRVLLSGEYVIPLFHLRKQWVAHASRLAHPARTPLYGYHLDSWWGGAR